MDRLTRYVIIFTLSLGCAQICAVANSQALLQDKTSKKATGSVAGHITVQGKGVAGIIVGIRTGEFGPQAGPVVKATTDQQGNYRITDVPAGVAQFQLDAQDPGLLRGFVLSRVERDGVVLPRGVEIKSGEQVSGVRIVVVYGSGIIRGTVKVGNGPLPTGARLMVRLEKPGDPSFAIRPQDVDARGRFAVEGVPAGSYDLWVHSFIPALRSGRPTKQSVSVTDGSVTEVEVVIDLDANPSPRP